ncbi:MAG: hypothetical protein A2Y76_03655 [Planctomycetes bacterium RBG_13_60_9]|nr:MAG: hypothetical protein A2Y76_03655 [Planctomycetes bacterium RBG_13_60_9]
MRKYEAEMDGEGQRDKDAEGQSREEAKPAQCAERSQSDARAREPSVGSLPAGASRGTHGQDAHATSVCKTNPIPMTSEEQRDAAVETQDFASPRSHDGQESSQASVDAPACKTNPIPMTSAEQTDAAVETQNLASPRSHDAQETFQASVDAPPCKTDPIGEGLSGRG